jgi:LPXTG-site transpeptidase (sortase) family protein
MGVADGLPGALPNGLEVANPANATNTCGGSLTAIPGSQNIQLIGGGLAGNASCAIAVDVISTQPGVYINTIPAGALTADGGITNNDSTTDTLTVNPGFSLGNRSSSPSQLPKTGFAPNVVTDLNNTPQEIYSTADGISVEIPSLGINIPIVGVPLKNGTWNVDWLGNQAGWLEGSAFPSWNGNSLLTGHVYLANGKPGPFVSLSKLKYGDLVIIHAYGEKYTFAVQTNAVVAPNNKSVMKHEEKPWLTLITCKNYDESTNTYLNRTVVRAILVRVSIDK